MSSQSSIPDNPPLSPSAPPSPHGLSIADSDAERGSANPLPTTPPRSSHNSEDILKNVGRTPLQAKVSSHQQTFKSVAFLKKAQTEMAPHYYEMEYDTFMSSFVNVDASVNIPSLSINEEMRSSITKVKGASSELSMYAPLCEVFNEVVGLACPHNVRGQKYTFKDTSSHPESSHDDIKPDLAMYPDIDQAKQAFSYNVHSLKEHAARTAWAWMTMPIEVKHDVNCTAFYFDSPSTGLLRDTELGKESQAQIIKYATQIMIRQHRTFVFILYIFETKARLTRWDRTGCIVSEHFDFEAEPEKLLNFIYRLALMPDRELGYDTSATLATREEVRLVSEIRRPNGYARKCAAEILAPHTQVFYPIYKITCANINGEGEGVYYIGKHRTATYSLMGRATKGYIMFVQGSHLLGFLKDYWRPVSARIPQELDIYRKLKEAEVRRVATAIGGGDVVSDDSDDSEHQVTITNKFLQGDVAPLEREHCRIALKEFARPLEDYEDSKGLITIVSHALEGHDDAWNKAKILHRDISVNNIMFVVSQDEETTREMNGILIDWDLCKERDELNNNRTQNGRSGTWAFMSALSLLYPLKPNDLADDLESFIHVITYYSLRFHRHNMTRSAIKLASEPISEGGLAAINGPHKELGTHVSNFYLDYVEGEDGLNRGGKHKHDSALLGRPGWWFTDASPALNYLVTSFYILLKKHYEQVDFASLWKRYSTLPGPPDQISSEQDYGSNSSAVDGSGLVSLAEAPKWHTDELDVIIDGPEQMNEPPKGLNSHQEIMAVFKEAIRRLNNEKKHKPDKTQDQFYRLPELFVAAPPGPTGVHRSSLLKTEPTADAAATASGAHPMSLKRDTPDSPAAGGQEGAKKSRTNAEKRQTGQEVVNGCEVPG
ncbi:hypothetical protein BDY19DRAFT_906019 [Irpex rosettiformis]|uniref:Uncharacterized protein n=1 Tax=Irpex rosettiformis TaxID=378272 RepID=A0ACB8U3X2_9APHY|nr:hypothetical protein BDY19DRAFT_906019 [Irpex rosettiformis]